MGLVGKTLPVDAPPRLIEIERRLAHAPDNDETRRAFREHAAEDIAYLCRKVRALLSGQHGA